MKILNKRYIQSLMIDTNILHFGNNEIVLLENGYVYKIGDMIIWNDTFKVKVYDKNTGFDGDYGTIFINSRSDGKFELVECGNLPKIFEFIL